LVVEQGILADLVLSQVERRVKAVVFEQAA
jgi:hypothetical protein